MKYLLLLVSILIWGVSFTYAQGIKLGASEDPSAYEPLPSIDKISKKKVRLLTIGIGRFNDNNFSTLKSYIELYRFKTEKIAADYIWPSYDEHELIDGFVNEIVEKDKIASKLHNLATTSAKTDVVIISILSHGAYKDGEYYLICTDSKTDDYENTAISGRFLRDIIKAIADKGAIVLLFLDTCHAGALYNNVVNFTPKDNGIIAFYASSSENESAKEIMLESFFTKSFVNTLGNQNKDAFINGFVTLGSIGNQIQSSVRNQKRDWEQHPDFKFYPKNQNVDYPIVKKVDSKIESRIDSIPISKIPLYIYFGAAVGTNIKPTPQANAIIGFDINQRHKIEFGASLAFTQSDDVFIYNKNGILQNGYNYRGWNIYGRYGYNIMPQNSKLEIVPLIGLSGNFITGKQLSGYNSIIGKSASSLMSSINCRFAYSLCKDKKLLLHGTLGCDLPIKKDGNVDILKEDKYIKNWCSIRPYVEIGIIAKLFHF